MTNREILLQLGLTAALILAGAAIYHWQKSSAVVPSLISALARDNFNQRRSVVARLNELGLEARMASASLLALTADLRSRDAPGAVTALARIDLSAARVVMDRARNGLRDPDLNTRRRAAEHLGNLGPLARPAVPDLIAATRDGDAVLRDRAVSALARIGIPTADIIPILIAALDDPTYHVRYAALSALETFPPPVTAGALTALKRATRDPNNLVSQRAVYTLRQIETDRGIASQLSVARLMLDHNRESILYTLHKLAMLGRDAAPLTAELTRLLRHREDSVRYAAIETLAAIGPPARAASAELQTLLQDREPVIRESARRALDLIAGGAKP